MTPLSNEHRTGRYTLVLVGRYSMYGFKWYNLDFTGIRRFSMVFWDNQHCVRDFFTTRYQTCISVGVD